MIASILIQERELLCANIAFLYESQTYLQRTDPLLFDPTPMPRCTIFAREHRPETCVFPFWPLISFLLSVSVPCTCIQACTYPPIQMFWQKATFFDFFSPSVKTNNSPCGAEKPCGFWKRWMEMMARPIKKLQGRLPPGAVHKVKALHALHHALGYTFSMDIK